MLTIQTPLFEAQDIRLGPIDYEKDPVVESKWTHDSEFMRLMELKAVRPLAPGMVKKQYESLEKEIGESNNLFYFTIRAREDDRLLGKAVLEWIDWSNGNGWVGTLGVRRPWRKRGLGLALLYRSFGELYKRGKSVIGLGVDAANPTGATRLYRKAGMRVASEYVSYEKEFRSGIEPEVET